jgi:hypothetical protein
MFWLYAQEILYEFLAYTGIVLQERILGQLSEVVDFMRCIPGGIICTCGLDDDGFRRFIEANFAVGLRQRLLPTSSVWSVHFVEVHVSFNLVYLRQSFDKIMMCFKIWPLGREFVRWRSKIPARWYRRCGFVVFDFDEWASGKVRPEKPPNVGSLSFFVFWSNCYIIMSHWCVCECLLLVMYVVLPLWGDWVIIINGGAGFEVEFEFI